MTLLTVDRLTKRFGGLVALNRVSFTVETGKIVGLIGPNGAGKTTLFNCITGVSRPEEGEILFSAEKDPLHKYSPHEVAECGIARTFQNIRLFSTMSVLENVLVGTHVRTKAGLLHALWPRSRTAHHEERWAVDRAMRLLEKMRLDSYAHHAAFSLSYGQQRRLELARALASDPELLLLDEPAAGLNFQERQELMAFVRHLKEEGLTILLIEHDMRVVMPISDWVVVLDYGATIAEGPPHAVQEDVRVIEAYLGTQVAE